MKYLKFLLLYLTFSYIMISPFLPGDYDIFSNPSAFVVQIYSGLGSLATLFSFPFIIRLIKKNSSSSLKIILWINFIVLLPMALFIFFGISKIMGLMLLLLILFVFILILKKINQLQSLPVFNSFSIIAILVLPLFLLMIQLLSAKPLTDYSRKISIKNSQPFITEIEKFKQKTGKYPVTLNALWRDYKTGITGTDKYRYNYDSDTYNLYFEQSKFFFDNFGTREMVVYNPKGNHMMLSHESWFMLIPENEIRNRQGWYQSFDTSTPNWKYFWFD